MSADQSLPNNSFIKCHPFENFFTTNGNFTKQGLTILLKANKFPFNKKATLIIEGEQNQDIFLKKIDIIEFMDWFNVKETSALYGLCLLHYNNVPYKVIKETIKQVFADQIPCIKE